MNRRWLASLAGMLAVTAQSLAQTPNALPTDTAGEPLPIIALPGRAFVTSPEQEKTKETEPIKDAPKSTTIAPAAPTAANSCAAPQKPIFIDSHCGPAEQVWLRASYLYWRVSDLPIPQVLVTVDGQTAFGNNNVDYGWVSGGRIEGGAWFDCQHICGIEFGGFLLQEKTRSFSAAADGSAGSATIGRPVLDPLPNVPVTVLVANPPGAGTTGVNGRIDITTSTQFGSAEFNIVRNLCYSDCWSFNGMVGVRYLDLNDDLQITTDSQAVSGTPFTVAASAPLFDRLTITDRFRTRNQMWAGQVGARAEYRSGIWFGAVRGSVALGPNHQVMDIYGTTNASSPTGATAGATGGLLAVPGGPQPLASGATAFLPMANGGTQKTDWFAVAPEVGVQAGVQLTRFARATIGYNFLYINNVVRPGDLIDTTINNKFVPSNANFGTQSGPDRPRLRFSRDDFMVHGVELGLEFLF